MDLRKLVLYIHLVAAVVWLGGVFFMALVWPVVRRAKLPNSSDTIRLMGRRFRDISWAAVVVLLVTGVGNMYLAGAFSNLALYFNDHMALVWKLVFVALMIGVKFAHDYWIGPRAALISSEIGFRSRWWKAAGVLGYANVYLGLIILYLALVLVKGPS